MKQFKLLSAPVILGVTLFLFSCGSGDQKTKSATQDTSQTKTAEAPPANAPEATTPNKMNIVIIRHKVANFSRWIVGYEGHDSARRANGLSNELIARGLNRDSNMVIVGMRAADMLKAKEFASSEDVKEVMQKAGVIGTPEVDYLEMVWR